MTFFRDHYVKATRKPHRCHGCTCTIPAQSRAYYFAMKGEDGVWYGHYHPDCREAEVRLNDLMGWGYSDDWCLLHDADAEDAAALRAEFPEVYARWDAAIDAHKREAAA